MAESAKRISRLCAAALLIAALSSCGYHLIGAGGGRGIYGGDITSVALPVFKNITFEPHASMYVTQAFSQELVLTGLFDLNKADPDGTFLGTIRRVIIVPNAMNGTGLVIQKAITVEVEVTLLKRDGVVVKRWFFADQEPYMTDDPAAEDFNKRNAIAIASGRMARKFTAVLLVDY